MKTDLYKIDNSIDKLLSGKNTLILDNKELNIIKSKLKKTDYKIYYPNKSSERVILYKNEIPKISLFKINSLFDLKHNEIMGSILGLNINSSYLGDIVLYNNNYYFYILSELNNFIKDNLNYIGNKKINLEEIDINYLSNYEREFEEFNIIVSSLRIDNIISKIIKTNREKVIEIIKDKKVILNYEVLSKGTYILKENDIFSIKRFGKYKFIGIIKETKKNNYMIKYLKYK